MGFMPAFDCIEFGVGCTTVALGMTMLWIWDPWGDRVLGRRSTRGGNTSGIPCLGGGGMITAIKSLLP